MKRLTVSSFLLFGHPDQEDTHKVRAALRPSTLRRQLQVVDAMADCRLGVFRVPQVAKMLNPAVESKALEELSTRKKLEENDDPWKSWPNKSDHYLRNIWTPGEDWLNKAKQLGYINILKERLQELSEHTDRPTEAASTSRPRWNRNTWATVFNGATWSLLNVHRDTLRELGLFLEDLYSWSPKELRSVVLTNILAQDRIVRRTVVDRWFNRTDYRRSQVLSLLAANIFRPWMAGEEPYGDDELAIRTQLELEQSQPNHFIRNAIRLGAILAPSLGGLKLSQVHQEFVSNQLICAEPQCKLALRPNEPASQLNELSADGI